MPYTIHIYFHHIRVDYFLKLEQPTKDLLTIHLWKESYRLLCQQPKYISKQKKLKLVDENMEKEILIAVNNIQGKVVDVDSKKGNTSKVFYYYIY